MSVKFPSASAVERAVLCPFSCTLPRVSDEPGEAALRGTAIHAFIASYLDVDAPAYSDSDLMKEVADFDTANLIEHTKKLFGEEAGTLKSATELTFAFNPLSGACRVLGAHLNRAYGNAGPDEIVGTVDIIHDRGVWDWKTGRESNTTVVAENWQMRTLSVMAAKVYGWEECSATLLFVNPDGSVNARAHTFSKLDLAEFEAQLKTAFLAARDPSSQPQPGAKQCRYCPSVKWCPTMDRMAETTVLAQPHAVERRFLQLLVEDPQRAYEAHKQLEAVTRFLGKELYKAALSAPIDIGGGKIYGKRETTSTELDTEKVYDVLARTYGPDVARSAMSMSTSKAGIERAVAPIAAKGGKAEAVRWVMATLENEGAVKRTAKTKVDEHRARADAIEVEQE